MPKYIDLTHTLSESIGVYPGKTPFKRKIYQIEEHHARMDDMELSMGIGTHIDAPRHFCPELGGADQLEISHFFAPGCVINLADQVQNNADFLATAADLEHWEKTQQTQIPKDSICFIYTGWSQYWQEEKFCAVDSQGKCHFPGIDTTAAELLVSRGVIGVGIDTMGIDAGISDTYPVHKILLPKKIYILENVANLELLPPLGAAIYAFPMKIADAPEAPVRLVAVLA